MFKSLNVAVILTLGLLCYSISVNADISGIWQHESKPALISINLEKGLATVKQHDDNVGSEGLTIIKSIKPLLGSNEVWSGEMFNGYIDSYVYVTINLIDVSTIVVLDDSGKEVLRLVRE